MSYQQDNTVTHSFSTFTHTLKNKDSPSYPKEMIEEMKHCLRKHFPTLNDDDINRKLNEYLM